MGPDFRHILRDRSHQDHDRVDRAMSAYDVATEDGLRRFLHIHHLCFSHMRAHCRPGVDAHDRLTDMIDRIERDLHVLGAGPGAGVAHGPGPCDPLALDYLIEGSRLGSTVLARHWMTSRYPAVRAADAYFSLEPMRGRWRDVCDQLSAIAPDSPRATAILQDTQALFRLFSDVARQTAPDFAA